MEKKMSASVSARRTTNDYYRALHSHAGEVEARYRTLTPRSCALFDQAKSAFPGGYTRDSLVREPYAPFLAEGAGSTLTDADGRRVVDLWFNATSLPLGHAHPDMVSAVERQVTRGTAFFGPTEHELRLAALLKERLPSAERVRFANSGSEAVMMAIRFARAFRNRPVIVKFEGSYHGSYDDVSWSVSPSVEALGDGDAPSQVADSAGLLDCQGRVALLPFNDVGALEAFVEAHHARLAAILVEPIANRIGLILPDRTFLSAARALCDRYDIVLLFDEVIAFRAGFHGAQGEIGITPDLTTLGKIIGGGFPVGAIVGRAEILELSRPSLNGRVSHAGTFNANPVTAVAGLATMQALTPKVFAGMAELGERVRRGLREIVADLPLRVTGIASLFKVTAVGHEIRNYRDAAAADKEWETIASLALYNEGFLLTPRLSGCVSAVTSGEEALSFLEAFRRVVAW
jgi:glutamate-1-semialdehyde 2,1-aminomutase